MGGELLAAYTASRTLLERNREGGVDALVRPRIEVSLLEETWRLHLVKEWVARHPGDERTGDAKALLERVEDSASRSGQESARGGEEPRGDTARRNGRADRGDIESLCR